jgi:hypothetical protein
MEGEKPLGKTKMPLRGGGHLPFLFEHDSLQVHFGKIRSKVRESVCQSGSRSS